MQLRGCHRQEPEQQMPIECEWSHNKIHPRLGIEYLEKNLALCRVADNKLAIAGILTGTR